MTKEKRTKKCKAKKKEAEKHCLDDDLEDEFDAVWCARGWLKK